MIIWYWFWMITIASSAMLFFGVAILVAIFGWRDLRDLFRDLQSQHTSNRYRN